MKLKVLKPTSRSTEEWRDIPGYEGLYLVSNQGRVYSYRRQLYLRPFLTKKGYLYVTLTVGKQHRYLKAALVLAAFSGPRPTEYTVNHKDGDKSNDAFFNLEYLTDADNIRHAIAIGLKGVYGEDNPRARLTNGQVLEISRLWKTGQYRRAALANQFNISLAVIDRIIYQTGWKTVLAAAS